ncbi:membrane protein [Gallibacterium anatis]|uniref:CidA/LrgA family protein n=1 Tax=Gallibacterium anatis TaxID=750 RepID=UPI000531509A|nr:CidA/LrgA family protein [Gallibacterium anatis]KGQ49699.1 membrane protein [Gallibacterium anatis]
MFYKIFQLFRSIAILYAMLYLGEAINYLFPIGIPSSIWGLLLLFICLVLKLIKKEWLLPSSALLIRYMALLFIPLSVGIIDYFDVLTEQAVSLLIPTVVSTCLVIVMTGLLAEYLYSYRSFTRLRKKAEKRAMRGAK